jgi:hypothetical protein
MTGEPDDVDSMVEPVMPSRHRWLAALDWLAEAIPLRRI